MYSFSPEWLRKAAEETGLIKRERKIDPTIMFWVLVMSFGVRLQRTLASIKRNYEKASIEKMSDSSWYERFTPELVAFLKLCVIHAIEHLAEEQNRVLNERIAKFQDVLIPSFDEFVDWYNNRPHGSLNFKELETPEQAFWRKLRPEANFGIGNRLFGL